MIGIEEEYIPTDLDCTVGCQTAIEVQYTSGPSMATRLPAEEPECWGPLDEVPIETEDVAFVRGCRDRLADQLRNQP